MLYLAGEILEHTTMNTALHHSMLSFFRLINKKTECLLSVHVSSLEKAFCPSSGGLWRVPLRAQCVCIIYSLVKQTIASDHSSPPCVTDPPPTVVEKVQTGAVQSLLE